MLKIKNNIYNYQLNDKIMEHCVFPKEIILHILFNIDGTSNITNLCLVCCYFRRHANIQSFKTLDVNKYPKITNNELDDLINYNILSKN
jgi:hypothetical protein